MRKNLTALALCLALATSAAACGNKVEQSDSTKESNSAGEKTEITGEYVSSTDLDRRYGRLRQIVRAGERV